MSKGSILGNTLVFDPPNTLYSKSIIFNIGARLIFHHACKNGHGSIFRLYGIDLKKMSGFFGATQQHAEGPPTHLLSHWIFSVWIKISFQNNKSIEEMLEENTFFLTWDHTGAKLNFLSTWDQNVNFCNFCSRRTLLPKEFAPEEVCSRRFIPIFKLLPQCAEVFPGDLKMTFFFTFSLEKFNGALKLAGLALAFVLCLTQHFYCGKMLSRLNMNIE